MNGKRFDKRINRDFDRAKRDLAVLKDDAVTGLNMKFEQLAERPIKTAEVAMKTLNKSIGQGLHQYNAKVQGVVSNVPGDLSKKVAGYPWVAITASMVLGMLLGVMLKPVRHVVS